MEPRGRHHGDDHAPCYTHTLLTWWEAEADRPVATEINGQRYRLVPVDGPVVESGTATLLEPVLSAEKGLLLRLLQEWENASTADCERALDRLPEAEHWDLPEELVLDLVVALARFYHLRWQRLTGRPNAAPAPAEHVGTEVA